MRSTDVRAYTGTTKFLWFTLLSTNDITFVESVVIWLVKRGVGDRYFIVPSCACTLMLWKNFKWSRLKYERVLGSVSLGPFQFKYAQLYFKYGKGFVKFIYSEKARKFCEISTLLLTVCTAVKSKVEILKNFVAFSEYMNFTKFMIDCKKEAIFSWFFIWYYFQLKNACLGDPVPNLVWIDTLYGTHGTI